MPNAQISQLRGVQVGNFIIPLSLTEAVSGLSNTNLNAVAVEGTLPTFAITGSGTDYNIAVTLPTAGATGRFTLALQGNVMVVSSGITEALTSNTITIQYDNASMVTASWGTVDYRDGGEIVIPITFGEDITLLHKSDFTFEKVVPMGADADDVDDVWTVIDKYWLSQEVDDGNLADPRTFNLHIKMRPDKKGTFRVDLTGYVYKTASTIRDDVQIAPLLVPYGYIVPEIVDFEVQGEYTPGKPHMIRVAFNVPTTGWHQNNTVSRAETEDAAPSVWIDEGANLGAEPTPYKWTGDDPPDIHGEEPLISVITHNDIAMNVAVDAVQMLNIGEFNGAGPH